MTEEKSKITILIPFADKIRAEERILALKKKGYRMDMTRLILSAIPRELDRLERETR